MRACPHTPSPDPDLDQAPSKEFLNLDIIVQFYIEIGIILRRCSLVPLPFKKLLLGHIGCVVGLVKIIKTAHQRKSSKTSVPISFGDRA